MSEQAKPQGITAIAVRGFKSLHDEARIEVRPLTVLAGANSSGKSSIIQPLLLLKQTLEAPYDPGPLKLDGPNVVFTSARQFLSRGENAKAEGFSVALELKGIDSIQTSFKRIPPSKKLEVTETYYHSPDLDFLLHRDMTEAELTQQVQAHLRFTSDIIDSIYPNKAPRQRFVIEANRCFLELHRIFELTNGQASLLAEHTDSRQYVNHITRTIHVPGIRGNPERSYQNTGVTGPKFAGVFENYIAGLIQEWQDAKSVRLKLLNRYLRDLGLTSRIRAQAINDAKLEIRVARTLQAGRDLVSIADVGFGVSQVLPVLVALLAADSGQLVYIEQPELHLHPRAQVALAGLLADAASRGVRLVIETHSDLLLLGIQTLVAEGKLGTDKVILHWFERGDDGATTITSRELDDEGAYGDWPEDFGAVDFAADKRYLDAVERRHVRP